MMADVIGKRIVPPRDRYSIRKDTYRLRELTNTSDKAFFPIMYVLECVIPLVWPEFYVQPVDDGFLKGRAAETIPEQHLIRVKESVYNAACQNHPWARKVMAHELAHYFYHDSAHVAYAYPQHGERIPKE